MSTGLVPAFNDVSIQRAINRAVSRLEADKTFAMVAHIDDQEGASLSVVVKVNDEWKFEGTVVKGWDQPFRYGAEVIWSR
jgi:hypothetical protein